MICFLDSNPEHNQLWEEFSERNLLRKMHLAFNLVPHTSEQLQQMDSTEIKAVADNVGDPSDKFVIEVPELKQEFPELANEKSKVYPLPLSFENQCTTMGAANNLSLFSEEFNFPCESTERYIPMRKTTADFNVDAAYERYSFLKLLDKHKEKQVRYENILRRRGSETNESGENADVLDNTIIGVVDSDSDSEDYSD